MRIPPPNVLELPLEERAFMALEAAVERAMEEHARAGHSVYVERDGKIVEVTAEELRVLYPNYLQVP
jgi:hypothetical protein